MEYFCLRFNLKSFLFSRCMSTWKIYGSLWVSSMKHLIPHNTNAIFVLVIPGCFSSKHYAVNIFGKCQGNSSLFWYINIELKKAIQMKPTFEVHYIVILELMKMDLMHLKRNYMLDAGFYGQVRDLCVNWINNEFSISHGDIKPRVALQNLLLWMTFETFSQMRIYEFNFIKTKCLLSRNR